MRPYSEISRFWGANEFLPFSLFRSLSLSCSLSHSRGVGSARENVGCAEENLAAHAQPKRGGEGERSFRTSFVSVPEVFFFRADAQASAREFVKLIVSAATASGIRVVYASSAKSRESSSM